MGGTDSGSDAAGSYAARPGVHGDTAGGPGPDGVTLEVDGELFAVRPDAFGGTSYTWLSGPDEGYGFGESPTPDRSDAEHREAIRSFLAQVDPATGHLEDD